MSELIRDTIFGRFVRLASGRKLLTYEEERNPEIWKQFVHHEKTRNVAHHGTIEPELQSELADVEKSDASHGSSLENSLERNSSRSRPIDRYQTLTGHPVDAERGKDLLIVDWYGDNDPENPMSKSKGCLSSCPD
jgi:DHA1 family multidrug resistance protein-like MFS transporter